MAVLALLLSLPAVAALDPVSGLFQETRYGEARQALDQDAEGFRAGEETLWRVRLATVPAEALIMLREGLADKSLPMAVRIRMTLESANIEFGRGNYQSSLKVLTPLLNEAEGRLPGDIYLRAGLSFRALGQLQKAREMLGQAGFSHVEVLKIPQDSFNLHYFCNK